MKDKDNDKNKEVNGKKMMVNEEIMKEKWGMKRNDEGTIKEWWRTKISNEERKEERK